QCPDVGNHFGIFMHDADLLLPASSYLLALGCERPVVGEMFQRVEEDGRAYLQSEVEVHRHRGAVLQLGLPRGNAGGGLTCAEKSRRPLVAGRALATAGCERCAEI